MRLENQLTQNDSSIRVGGNAPDLVIDCNVSRYGAPESHTETRDKTTTSTIGPPVAHIRTTEELRHYVIDEAARQIASYLVNTTEVIDVPLASIGPRVRAFLPRR